MKDHRKTLQKVSQILVLILVCILLGPELFVFAPEIVLFLDVVGLEMLMGSAAILLIPMREYILNLLRTVVRNEYFRKYGLLIPFVLVAPIMPELVVFMDVEILSALLLFQYRKIQAAL